MIERNRCVPTVAMTSVLMLAAICSSCFAAGGGGGGPDDRYIILDNPPSPPKQAAPQTPGTTLVEPRKKKKEVRKSDLEFLEGYKRAYALAHSGEYEAAFGAFKALDEDDHPDVANHLGFISRKLGNYDESRNWYERALASNPNHTRTWQYHGMWHLEQGNRLKAEEHLDKIRLICGVECRDYALLKEALNGRISY